ncbi:hypothetical protein ANANG_G00287800 [Anguilla anguilla]|uniref:Uncharacterized protein n=1 Tax=Anguilla anguilla TaxID=7936 RepID=A0A9D3LKJ5_ANGAN|nr:hypothetical protein ANANG_G00287800 [Anguilla anguilla]
MWLLSKGLKASQGSGQEEALAALHGAGAAVSGPPLPLQATLFCDMVAAALSLRDGREKSPDKQQGCGGGKFVKL